MKEKRGRHYSHMPEREPEPGDYTGVDRVEIVHMDPNGKGDSPRDKTILGRLRKLRKAGVPVRQVDIKTEPVNGDKNVVVGGALGDVCVPRRRLFLRERGLNAKIDSSLTSDG